MLFKLVFRRANMEFNGIETVYRFNGVTYDHKEDAEQAKRFDKIKQKLMTVLNVTHERTFVNSF